MNRRNPNKRLNSLHDLSKGDREYLERQGVPVHKFDKMPAEDQREWKEAAKKGEYMDMMDFEKKVKMIK